MARESELADNYSDGLGKILVNLMALEFSLRMRLSYDDPKEKRLVTSFHELKVGQSAPINSVTSFESLKDLLNRYNNALCENESNLKVGPDIVLLRDSLVHGRALSETETGDSMLVKFSAIRDGVVRVEFAQTLSPDWIKAHVEMVYSAVIKVHESMKNWRDRNGVKTA